MEKKRAPRGAPRIFWNLFNLKPGDFVIAIEGIKVRGISRVRKFGYGSYKFDDSYRYAHGFGYKLDWHDWDEMSPINLPRTPNQSVDGIARVRKEADSVVEQCQNMLNMANFSYPEELDSNQKYFEGTKTTIVVNSYERNSDARRICLENHGYNCAVCEINFGNYYGEVAEKYIHVHHLTPIHTVEDKYEIDQVKHLIPVCPNCHAVIHMRKSEPYSVKELKEKIAKR